MLHRLGALAISKGLIVILFAGLPRIGLAENLALFRCDGEVEQGVWQSWDDALKELLSQDLLGQRLKAKGDVYALYDFQTYTHNLVSMARRCGRVGRLREMARLVQEAYGSLDGLHFPLSGRRWTCRGGAICTSKNRQMNAEVMLCSVQFLGVATAIANAMVASGTALSRDDEAFVADTVRIAVEHLLRWGNDWSLTAVAKKTGASADDVIGGSSGLFFTDKPLWQIGIYAELAGVLAAVEDRRISGIEMSAFELRRLRRHYAVLTRFLRARVSLEEVSISAGVRGLVADIDRGFWRNYSDGRYAGYTGDEKPVVCATGDDGRALPKIVITTGSVPQLADTGWDISHARRLVHVLDALRRNEMAITRIWGARLEPSASILGKAFANTLVRRVWNGDADYPLFANYWSGANGWYRVAWDNGTGQCREGTPPSGLTSSFPTGGYATWAAYESLIGELGVRLYAIFQSDSVKDMRFTERYYPDFARGAQPKKAALAGLMFLPSLVENGN